MINVEQNAVEGRTPHCTFIHLNCRGMYVYRLLQGANSVFVRFGLFLQLTALFLPCTTLTRIFCEVGTDIRDVTSKNPIRVFLSLSPRSVNIRVHP
jgi:hypothetical protein